MFNVYLKVIFSNLKLLITEVRFLSTEAISDFVLTIKKIAMSGNELNSVYLGSTQGGNPFFSIDPGIIIWVWIVFFVTLSILHTFAWKPILKMLHRRERKIEKAISNSKRIEVELKKTQTKIDTMLNSAEEKKKEILKFARKEAEELKNFIEDKARETANNMIKKAKENIEIEHKEAIQSLRSEVIKLSIEIAKKVLDENMDEEKNLQLAHKYLNEF